MRGMNDRTIFTNDVIRLLVSQPLSAENGKIMASMARNSITDNQTSIPSVSGYEVVQLIGRISIDQQLQLFQVEAEGRCIDAT